MVNNDDWDICFLLNTYFQLCNCELSTFFKFLEEIINPVVRAEYEQLKIIEDIVGFFIATAFAEEIALTYGQLLSILFNKLHNNFYFQLLCNSLLNNIDFY